MKEKILQAFIVLAFFTTTAKAFRGIEFLGYAAPFFFFGVILSGLSYVSEDKNILLLLTLNLLFACWCAVTSLWSPYPAYSFLKSGYYAVISTGAIIAGKFAIKEKPGMPFPILVLFYINIAVAAVSLFSLVFKLPADSWSGGNHLGFMGFAGHQNTLAALILFTLPGVLFLLLNNFKNKEKRHIVSLLTILLLVDIIILLLTWSRAAILSAAAGFLLFLLLTKRKRELIFLAGTVVLAVILISVSAEIRGAAEKILLKDTRYLTESRNEMWSQSWQAAKLNFIYGAGYGISTPGINGHYAPGIYEGVRYEREKGNSFLALIEETGIPGTIIFMSVILFPFAVILRKRFSGETVSAEKYLILSFLAAFILHAQFEGWWMGAGSLHISLFFISIVILSNDFK